MLELPDGSVWVIALVLVAGIVAAIWRANRS
jgi:hypothetical protein